MQPVPARVQRDMQEAIQVHGQAVQYTAAAGGPTLNIRARVRYASESELANAIENYRLVVTMDARDFLSAPLKGDTMLIDGTRRGVMTVREIRASGGLIAYQCGVQG